MKLHRCAHSRIHTDSSYIQTRTYTHYTSRMTEYVAFTREWRTWIAAYKHTVQCISIGWQRQRQQHTTKIIRFLLFFIFFDQMGAIFWLGLGASLVCVSFVKLLLVSLAAAAAAVSLLAVIVIESSQMKTHDCMHFDVNSCVLRRRYKWLYASRRCSNIWFCRCCFYSVYIFFIFVCCSARFVLHFFPFLSFCSLAVNFC